MSEEKKYFLFNSVTNYRTEALDQTELAPLLTSQNLENWHFWMDGMNDWQKASACEALKALLPVKKNVVAPPPVPRIPPAPPVQIAQTSAPMKPTPKATPAAVDESFFVTMDAPTNSSSPQASEPLAKKSLSGPDNRKHERVDMRLRAVITNKVKAFVTFTENISLGGLLTAHSIPEELLLEDCEVFLYNPGDRTGVSFKCSPIPENSSTNRFYFVIKNEKHHETLKQWIKEHSSGKKKSA